MKHFLVESIGEESIVAAIASAKWRVLFYAPGLSLTVAKALIEKAEAFRVAKAQKGIWLGFHRSSEFRVAIEVTPRAILDGWGEAEAIRKLWVYDVEQHTCEEERWFYVTKSLRIGILIVDDETFLFTPLRNAVGAGWNGVHTTYELMLKEVEADFLTSPIAKRLVRAEDIDALANANLLTREALEDRVHVLEDNLQEKDEKIEEQQAEIEKQTKRADAAEAEKAELKAQVEKQTKAFEDYKKEVHQPLLHGIKFSVKKFKLERLTLKAPQDLVKEVATNSNKDEIDLHIRFSEAEVKEIFNGEFTVKGVKWTLEKIDQAIEACREEYLFGVSYEERDFIDPKKSIQRREKVILKEHEKAFSKKINALKEVLWALKFEFKKKIEQKIQEKINRIFAVDLSEEKNIFDLFPELKASLKKFDPEIDVQLHSIDVKVLDTTTFQVGLFDALAKKHLNPGVGYDVQKDKGWNVLLENGVMDKELRVDRFDKRDYDEKDKRDVIKALYENYRNRLSVESTTKE